MRQNGRMRVYLGGDHGGYELKQAIAEHLSESGHEPTTAAPPRCVSTSSRGGRRVCAGPPRAAAPRMAEHRRRTVAAERKVWSTVTESPPLSTLDETIESVTPAVSHAEPQNLTGSILT